MSSGKFVDGLKERDSLILLQRRMVVLHQLASKLTIDWDRLENASHLAANDITSKLAKPWIMQSIDELLLVP